MASASELSHDKYGETDYLATSMSLNTSADTIFKYENKANYQIEDRRNVDKFQDMTWILTNAHKIVGIGT